MFIEDEEHQFYAAAKFIGNTCSSCWLGCRTVRIYSTYKSIITRSFILFRWLFWKHISWNIIWMHIYSKMKEPGGTSTFDHIPYQQCENSWTNCPRPRCLITLKIAIMMLGEETSHIAVRIAWPIELHLRTHFSCK